MQGLFVFILLGQKSASWQLQVHSLTHLWLCEIQLIWNRNMSFTPLWYISVEYLTSCLPLYHTFQKSAFSLCTQIFCIIFCGKWTCKMSTILVLWLMTRQPDKSWWQVYSVIASHICPFTNYVTKPYIPLVPFFTAYWTPPHHYQKLVNVPSTPCLTPKRPNPVTLSHPIP